MSFTAQHIIQSAPLRFRPEKAANIHAILHFIISGTENFSYSIVIENNACTLYETLIGTPHCIVTTTATIYIAIETGKLNPQVAFLDGTFQVTNIAKVYEFSKCFRKFEAEETTISFSENTPKNSRKGPLEGVKIVDFTRLLPGPLATMLLADMGADVIKVEDPDAPDYIRSFEPMIDGISSFYFALNRNKKSLALNFAVEEGRELAIDLIKTADVLIEQYRPGTMAHFGLSYDTLRAIHPRLIYLSITGYGQHSSMAAQAGHDINYIAQAGLLNTTMDAHGEPVIPGFQLADVAGGSYMAITAITTALYQREKTGVGEYIDLAMTDAALPFMALPLAAFQATGERKLPGTQPLSGGLANYNCYRCKDDKHVALGALEPKFWAAFCERIQKPEWAGNSMGDMTKDQDILKNSLKDLFKQKDRDEWIHFFEGVDVCISPVIQLDEIVKNKYLNERNSFIDFEINGKAIKTIHQPLRFASMPATTHWAAPALGEDTLSILKEMNLSEAQITELINKNIVQTV